MSPRNIPGRPSRLYKLKKALNGLKQAHLAWHKRLCADLLQLNFHELSSASCVFRRKYRGFYSFILVYVDDLLIISTTQEEVDQIVAELGTLYKLRRAANVELFLGTHLNWQGGGENMQQTLRISQEMYVQSILRRFGMVDCKPAITPMIEKFYNGLSAEEDETIVDIQLYQQMIGSLLFLALRTRPDILVAVLTLARFQQSPTSYCHRGAKRVLRYLKGTSDYGILFQPGDNDLSAYVDSDYASDVISRKSISGFAVKLGSAAVVWGARKQPSVALSTCEAEYFAMSIAAQEVVWIRKVIQEAGLPMNVPTALRSDNRSAICWATGEKLPSKRAKHIDVRVHFIRDLVARKELQIEYVSTEENDADMLTKPLSRQKLNKALARIWLQGAVEEEC